MKTIMKLVSIAILILVINISVKAQEEGGLESDNQEIIKSFEATLEDAVKINILPKVEAIVPSKKVYNYKLTNLPLDITYPNPIIKPLAAEADEPFKFKNFYGKFGFGNVKNPYANFKYYSPSSDNNPTFYLNASFNALNNEAKLLNQKMTKGGLDVGTGIKLDEKHFLDLDATANYDARNVFFYRHK